MSERSMRRARERREASERRREALRRRRAALLAGTAGAALLAGPAHAAELVVTTGADGPPDACDADCTLRDAITVANTNGEADTITFASTVTGTIRLTGGELPVYGDTARVTVRGPGAGVLTVSGDADANGPDDGDSRVFYVSNPGDLAAEGLTLTGSTAAGGGAVGVEGTAASARLADVVVTGSRATDGGGLFVSGGDLELVRTSVAGNDASTGSGGGIRGVASGGQAPAITLTDSTVADNRAPGSDGGGIISSGPLTLLRSAVTGNTAGDTGGGVYLSGRASLVMTGSRVSGNAARFGAGAHLTTGGKYGPLPDSVISGSTIADNVASEDGAGVNADNLGGTELRISRTTISGNQAADAGGGLRLIGENGNTTFNGQVTVEDSTLSGNRAQTGAGVAVGDPGAGTAVDDLAFLRTTIAANTASGSGGGVFLSSYETNEGPPEDTTSTPLFESTIVGDNSAPDGADLDREDDATSGGADLAFSLVEAPGDVPLFAAEGVPNRVGQDPQLGPLADNGGATRTHLPAQTSPVVDQGDAPATLATDQRGGPRTIDSDAANAPGGDGTDIGSVETARPADPPVGGSTGGTATTPVTPPQVRPRARPRGLTVRVTPRSDRRAPFRFRTSGRLLLPTGLTPQEGCARGVVAVQVKRGAVTISTRRVRLRRDCTFASTVVFRSPERFAGRRSLRFFVRFLGNDRVLPLRRRAPIVRRVG